MSGRNRNRSRNRKLRTIAHFDTTEPDEILRIDPPPSFAARAGRNWKSRLTWSKLSNELFDPKFLMEIIDLPYNRDVVHFLDANMFLHPTDDRIWRALLSRKGRVAIAEPILAELQDWIQSEPVFNEIAHTALRRTLENPGDGPIRIVEIPREGTPAYAAFSYYVHLLGLRKRGYEFAADKLKERGTGEIDRQTASNACRNIFGDRTQRMARELRDPSAPVIS